LFGVATASLAQLTPPPPGAVPTPEQLRPQQPQDKRAPDLPDRPATPLRELGKPSDDLAIDVASYSVDDSAPEALKRALPGLTAPYVGKGKSYEDLVNATSAVTRFLQRDLGYYLGYAFLPEQTPANGVIRIAVLEGRLDEVILNWPDKMPVQREVVERYLAHLKPGSILRVRDVERVVFLVNDLRGITTRFEVKPGRTPGTASLVVTPTPEARITSRAEFDTAGSRYSGIERASVLSTINSPAGRGDGLVLNALSSLNGGLQFALAGYTLPVGSDGLKIGGSLSYVNYRLDPVALPLGLNGTASTITGYGLYPFVRSRNLNLFGLVSVDAQDFDDRQSKTGLASKKKINSLQASVSGDVRDDLLTGGIDTYEVSVLRGRLSLDRFAQGNDTPPDFTLARLGATRLQNIVTDRLLAYMSVRAQVSANNLDNVEQFQLGGPDRVRAFAPGEATGDEGVVGTLELRLLPPEQWFGRISRELVFSAFVDAGKINFRRSPPQTADFVRTASLSGWGLGGVWERANNFSLRAYLAWPISGKAVNDPDVKKPRVYATASKAF